MTVNPSGPNKTQSAHRFSWELHNGPIPDGLLVLHKCDNPSCVNPDHLFLGTNQDNTDDKIKKGRDYHPSGDDHFLHVHPEMIRAGESSHRAKLTWEKVREIRAKYAQGDTTEIKLAMEYGVVPGTIHFILSGQTWVE